MASIYKFEDLEIWKLSKELVLEVYAMMSNVRDFDFKSQIQRAAISIMNNIAEGFDRSKQTKDNKLFANFLSISLGSCGEVKSMSYLLVDLQYSTPEKVCALQQHCDTLSVKISNLAEKIRNNEKPQSNKNNSNNSSNKE